VTEKVGENQIQEMGQSQELKVKITKAVRS
jgi:hypothetical protein